MKNYSPPNVLTANFLSISSIPVAANNSTAPTIYNIADFLISAFPSGDADIYLIANTTNMITATATATTCTIPKIILAASFTALEASASSPSMLISYVDPSTKLDIENNTIITNIIEEIILIVLFFMRNPP